MCMYLFLVRRWDPVAERQIWKGAWSSILVYQFQCYSQPVCLSVCLSAHQRDEAGGGMWGSPSSS